MAKPRKKASKALYIALSILLACAMWLYVHYVDNPDEKVTVSAIPVTFLREDVLNANNLMLVEKKNETVSLQVQGKWSVVSNLRRDNVNVQVDLGGISGPGEYDLAFDINWPSSISGNSLSVLNRTPFYVSVVVGRQVTQQKEIKGVFEGNLAEGCQGEGFTFQPETIQVSGEEKAVAQVAYAQVTLNRKDLDETVQDQMEYTLIGQDGKPLDMTGLTVEPATVGVTYSVVKVKQVPLTVDLLPGGGATGEEDGHVTCEITPASLMLSGSESDLAAYSSINLGTIDLSKVISSEKFTFPIRLGEEVTNLSGVQEAVVEVKISGLQTVVMETENIEIIGYPESMEVTRITQSLPVQVRGTSEALALVLPQYIRVVVDLSGKFLPAGQSAVEARVSLSGVAEAGVIGEYKVSISLPEQLE